MEVLSIEEQIDEYAKAIIFIDGKKFRRKLKRNRFQKYRN